MSRKETEGRERTKHRCPVFEIEVFVAHCPVPISGGTKYERFFGVPPFVLLLEEAPSEAQHYPPSLHEYNGSIQ